MLHKHNNTLSVPHISKTCIQNFLYITRLGYEKSVQFGNKTNKMPTLLYDNKTWTVNSKNGRKIQAMDIKLLTNVKDAIP